MIINIMFIWIIVAILLFVLVVVMATNVVAGGRRRRGGYTYKKADCVMTQSEKICFEALQKAAGNTYYIFPQMHLSAILNHKINRQSWYGAFRHINGKSVDFVLCDKVMLKPMLVVELDDRTHERRDRHIRDREVERILKEADVPLLRLSTVSPQDPLAVAINGAITRTSIDHVMGSQGV